MAFGEVLCPMACVLEFSGRATPTIAVLFALVPRCLLTNNCFGWLLCRFVFDPGNRDQALQHTLAFGIGIHHAGLAEGDRTLVETLFEQGKIQVNYDIARRRSCFIFVINKLVFGNRCSLGVGYSRPMFRHSKSGALLDVVC